MKLRWGVCFLLFAIFVMSYVDRSLMPLAIPFIAREFRISPSLAGVVLSAFFVGYAFMQIPGGLLAGPNWAAKDCDYRDFGLVVV